MSRFVLAMYLMIVTAVGPTACCCTLTRLTTRLVPPPSSAGPTPLLCRHHSRTAKVTKDETGQHTPSKLPDGPGCPCKEGGQRQVDALPSAQDEARQSFARIVSNLFDFHLAISLDHILADWTVDSSVWDRETASSVSTDDLLYVFHMLRC